jgi:hypothetical protein
MTNKEAAEQKLCLECGKPGAPTYKLADGRTVRVCYECQSAWVPHFRGAVEIVPECCSSCGGKHWLMPCSYDEGGVPCPKCNSDGKLGVDE